MKRMLSIFFILLVVVLTACVQTEILDEIEIVTAIGYDLIDENTLQVTAVVPIFKADKTVVNDTFTEIAPLSKEARARLDLQSSKPFVSGKVEVSLYNNEIAEKGLFKYLDTLYRDPSVGSRVYLGVVKGNVKTLFKKQYGTRDNGLYLSDLIEQNVATAALPRTNLHEFMRSYFAKGQDPFLPIITKEGERVKVNGIALFREDKMVGEIKGDKMFTFKALMDKYTEADSVLIEIDDDDKCSEGERIEQASIYKVFSKRGYIFENINTKPKITIKLGIDATVREFSGSKIDKKVRRKIEKSMEKEVEKQAKKMITMFKELKIDPLGIGEQVRSRDRNWTKSNWNEIYPNIKVDVKVNVNLTQTGVVE